MPIPQISEPFPSRDVLIELAGEDAGKPTRLFTRWQEEVLLLRLAASPVLTDPVEVLDTPGNTALAGTIGGTQNAGVYSVNGYVQILTPAAVANSVQLTLGWTFNGQPFTEVFPVLNSIVLGNVLTRQSVQFTVRLDPNTAVSYSFAYVSNPAATMVWMAVLALTLVQGIEQ